MKSVKLCLVGKTSENVLFSFLYVCAHRINCFTRNEETKLLISLLFKPFWLLTHSSSIYMYAYFIILVALPVPQREVFALWKRYPASPDFRNRKNSNTYLMQTHFRKCEFNTVPQTTFSFECQLRTQQLHWPPEPSTWAPYLPGWGWCRRSSGPGEWAPAHIWLSRTWSLHLPLSSSVSAGGMLL